MRPQNLQSFISAKRFQLSFLTVKILLVAGEFIT